MQIKSDRYGITDIIYRLAKDVEIPCTVGTKESIDGQPTVLMSAEGISTAGEPEAIGIVAATLHTDAPFSPVSGNTLYIHTVYIELEYQNKGVGSNMLSSIHEECRSKLNLPISCIALSSVPILKDSNGNFQCMPLCADFVLTKLKLDIFYSKLGFQPGYNTITIYKILE